MTASARRRGTVAAGLGAALLATPAGASEPEADRSLFEAVFGPACFDTADLDRATALPSLIVCPEVTLTETFEDNVFRSEESAKSDLASEIASRLRLSGQANDTVLNLNTEIIHNRQVRFAENDFLDWEVALDAAPVADPRSSGGVTVLTGALRVSRNHEERNDPDSAAELGTNLNTFREIAGALVAERTVGDFGGNLSLEAERRTFLRTADDNGAERDRWTLTTTLALSQLLSGTRAGGSGTPSLSEVSFTDAMSLPGGGAGGGGGLGPVSALSLVGEISYARTFFDIETTPTGRDQGNREITADAGLAYSFSDVTDLSLRAGVSQSRFEDPEQDDEIVPELNARLSWLPSDLTLIEIAAETRLEQTQAGDANASLIRDNRITVQHALDYDIRLSLEGGVEVETFRGADRQNLDWDLGVGAVWALNDALRLSGDYLHEARRSDGASDFATNTLSVSLTARF